MPSGESYDYKVTDAPELEENGDEGANWNRATDGPSKGYGAARQPSVPPIKKEGERKETDKYRFY